MIPIKQKSVIIRYCCEIYCYINFLYISARLIWAITAVKWCYFRVISLMFVCVSTWLTERSLPAKSGNYATEGCEIGHYFTIKMDDANLISYRNWIKCYIFQEFAYFCHPRPFAFRCRAFVTVHDVIWHWYEIRMTLIFSFLRLFIIRGSALSCYSNERSLRDSYFTLATRPAM